MTNMSKDYELFRANGEETTYSALIYKDACVDPLGVKPSIKELQYEMWKNKGRQPHAKHSKTQDSGH
jgi:hypothetical protein